MSIVGKHKKLLPLLLAVISNLFGSMDVDEICYYYFTNNIQKAKEKSQTFLLHAPNTKEKALGLYFLTLLDEHFLDAFNEQAIQVDDDTIKAYFWSLNENILKSKEYYLKSIEQIDSSLKELYNTRTHLDYKSFGTCDLKLQKRFLQSQLGSLLIKNNYEEEGMKLIFDSKGKKTELDAKILYEKIKKDLKEPLRGKIGWTIEGFAAISNAKELFILKNYFYYFPWQGSDP
jgi:hypothetical protein